METIKGISTLLVIRAPNKYFVGDYNVVGFRNIMVRGKKPKKIFVAHTV